MAWAVSIIAASAAAAWGAATIGSAQIIDNSVASVDVRDASLSGADVKDASITSADIKDGSATWADLDTNTKNVVRGGYEVWASGRLVLRSTAPEISLANTYNRLGSGQMTVTMTGQ